VKEKTFAVESERLSEVSEKPSPQGQGDVQIGGNQPVQPSCRGTVWRSSQRYGVAPVHFQLLLLEHSAEFLLRKRLKMAEGQVGHGQPPVLLLFKNAKYLPLSSTK